MHHADRIVFIASIVSMIIFIGIVFNESLPLWCATPEVGINHLVQPLCSK